MIFQFDISGMEWILGLGIMFGFAILMNTLTFKEMSSFFIWLAIFNAFMVWCDLLPLWTLILCIICLIIIIFSELKTKKVSE